MCRQVVIILGYLVSTYSGGFPIPSFTADRLAWELITECVVLWGFILWKGIFKGVGR